MTYLDKADDPRARCTRPTPFAPRSRSATTARSSPGSSSCAAKRRDCSASRTSPTWCSRIAWRTPATRALAFLEDLKAKTERRFRRGESGAARVPPVHRRPDAPELAALGRRLLRREAARRALRFRRRGAAAVLLRWIAWSPDCSTSSNRLYGIRVDEETGVAGLGSRRCSTTTCTTRTARSSAASTPTGIRARTSAAAPGWTRCITGGPARRQFEPHLGLICGNLTPPVGRQPALLTHREVETIFHEFGHLLHHMLSRVEMRSRWPAPTSRGTSSSCRRRSWRTGAGSGRRSTCSRATSETGEPIPEDLFQKMKRARTFRAANAQMRQLGFGFVDLLLHVATRRSATAMSIAYTRRILQEFSPAPLPPQHAMIAAFTHLFAQPGRVRRRLLLLQMGRGAGRRRLHPLPGRRHLQPRGRDRVSREHPVEGRQRRSGRALSAASWAGIPIRRRCWCGRAWHRFAARFDSVRPVR